MTARTDADLLQILQLRDDGLTMRQIAARMRMSRNAVLGLYHRIQRDTEPSEHDGTMPYGWWREGLRRQAKRAESRR